jgi:hypothetical protein
VGLLLDSIKLINKKKSGSQLILEHSFVNVEFFSKVQGPIIDSNINSEFWYVKTKQDQ